jgi:hypothetical protein
MHGVKRMVQNGLHQVFDDGWLGEVPKSKGARFWVAPASSR